MLCIAERGHMGQQTRAGASTRIGREGSSAWTKASQQVQAMYYPVGDC